MNPSSLVERWLLVQAIKADPELSASAKVAALALMDFVNSKTGECFPTFEKIAACCHLSKRTVATATQQLERRGWVAIERDEGGDRESNRYHFAFGRIREGGVSAGGVSEAPTTTEFHGKNFAPCSEVHGAKSGRSMVQKAPVDGANFASELEEDNSIKRNQESLFGAAEPPTSPPFDFEAWFETQLWPQFPKKVGKAAAKKLCKATIEGRRGDGVQTTTDKMLAGLLRYAAAMTGTDLRYIKHPVTWISQGCWDDEYGPLRRRSAVWAAIDEMADDNEMAVRSKRGVG